MREKPCKERLVLIQAETIDQKYFLHFIIIHKKNENLLNLSQENEKFQLKYQKP